MRFPRTRGLVIEIEDNLGPWPNQDRRSRTIIGYHVHGQKNWELLFSLKVRMAPQAGAIGESAFEATREPRSIHRNVRQRGCE